MSSAKVNGMVAVSGSGLSRKLGLGDNGGASGMGVSAWPSSSDSGTSQILSAYWALETEVMTGVCVGDRGNSSSTK